MRVLVTGGCGFIGSHLVDALLDRNCEVVVLDSLEPRVHGLAPQPRIPKGVRFLQGDVRNKGAWEKATEGVEVIFHEAAYQDYMADYSTFFHTNVVGTALLFEVLREKRLDLRKVVVASSQAVYGEGQYECSEHGLLSDITRSLPQMRSADWEVRCPHCNKMATPRLLQEPFTNPCNQYALSKFSQELAALRLGRALDVPTVALRYSITQGPRQSLLNQYSGILRIFLGRLRSGKPLIIYEDGLQTRDFVHIADVVDANLTVLDSDVADYQAFNVGSGVRTTVLDYANRLLEKTREKTDVLRSGEFRVGDNRHSVSEVAKLRALGWSPRHSLDEIMNDFLVWTNESGPPSAEIPDAERLMREGGVVQTASAFSAV